MPRFLSLFILYYNELGLERYWINTLFLGLYMLVANVMLVNLLVALFATTYENVQEDADQIWKLKRFDVVMEYLHKDPIPTPIASIYHILKICKYFLYSLMASKKHRTIEIVCWPRVPGDHAVSLNKFPVKINIKTSQTHFLSAGMLPKSRRKARRQHPRRID